MRIAEHASERGFTFVELVIAIAVMGIAMVTMLQMLGLSLGHQSDTLVQSRTTALAEAYMQEILARRFDANAPPGGIPACAPAAVPCSTPSAFDDGETRAEYDDADDFDGLDELPPLDATGAVRAGYDRYRVQVSVAYPNAAQVTAFGLDNASDAKIVSITVTPPSGPAQPFSFIKGDY